MITRLRVDRVQGMGADEPPITISEEEKASSDRQYRERLEVIRQNRRDCVAIYFFIFEAVIGIIATLGFIVHLVAGFIMGY